MSKQKRYHKFSLGHFGSVQEYTVVFACFFAVSLALAGTASALDAVSVTRTGPNSVSAGGDVNVTIVVESNVNQLYGVVVEEQFAGQYVSSDGELVQERDPLYRPDFIRWEFNLPPGWRKELHYVVSPYQPGIMIMIPTAVYLENATGEYYVEPDYLEVDVTCNGNGRCETEEGEDYLTCPGDCTTGIRDDNCDLMEDERCDPDCEAGYDPDCGDSKEGEDLEVQPANLLLVFGAAAAIVLVVLMLLFFKRSKSAAGSVMPGAVRHS
jgi:hypothetical protein